MVADFISIAHLYITSFVQTFRDPRLFDDVKTFLIFIGHPP